MSTYSIYYETFLKDNVSSRLSAIGREFQNAFSGVKSTLRGFDKIGDVGRELALRISTPLTLGLGKALKEFKNFEQLENQFGVAFGKQADDMMAKSRQWANITALSLTQVSSLAAGMKMSVGMKTEDIMPFIQDYTTALYGFGVGANFDAITLQIKQILGKGKAMSTDINVIESWQFPITKMIKDAFGYSQEQITKMRSDGMITSEMVMYAIQRTARDPRYADSIKKYSESLAGRLDAMSGQLQTSFILIGKRFNESLNVSGKIRSLTQAIDSFTAYLEKLSPQTFKIASGLVVAGITIPPLLIGFSVLGKAFTYTFATLQPLLRGLHIFSGIKLFKNLGGVKFNLPMPNLSYRSLGKQLMDFRFFDRWVGLAVSLETGLINVFRGVFTFIRVGFGSVFATIIIIMTLFKALRGIWAGFTSTFQGDSQGIFRILGAVFTFLNQIIEFSTTSIEVLAILLGQGLGNLFNGITKWINDFTYAIKNIAEFFGYKSKTDEEKKKEKESNEDLKNLPKHVRERIIAMREKEKVGDYRESIGDHPIKAMTQKIEDINLVKEYLLSNTEKMQQARIDRLNKQKMEIKNSITLENKTDTPAKVTDTKTTLAQSGGNIFRVKGLNSDNTSVFI